VLGRPFRRCDATHEHSLPPRPPYGHAARACRADHFYSLDGTTLLELVTPFAFGENMPLAAMQRRDRAEALLANCQPQAPDMHVGSLGSLEALYAEMRALRVNWMKMCAPRPTSPPPASPHAHQPSSPIPFRCAAAHE
jgi:hypothetical protein